ncbi:hypothetical protein Q9233_005117 [Columba guinea]|nr:hypothetical protein Q9233_005117 [Columba guinea]
MCWNPNPPTSSFSKSRKFGVSGDQNPWTLVIVLSLKLLGALGKNFPTTFPLPKTRGLAEASGKHAVVLLCRSAVGWRRRWLVVPVTSRAKLGLSQSLQRVVGWEAKKLGLEGRMEKTISICFPGTKDENKGS